MWMKALGRGVGEVWLIKMKVSETHIRWGKIGLFECQ